jgi:hypothetical protein
VGVDGVSGAGAEDRKDEEGREGTVEGTVLGQEEGIKCYRAVTDVYRNRVPDFDDHLMLNAKGLWNFYLDAA